MKRNFTIGICLLLLSACGGETPPADVIAENFEGLNASHHCMDWKGTERCYYVVQPAGKPKHLIVALHPAFTPVRMTEKVAKLAARAVPRGYVVAYPEGVDRQWNDGRVMTEVKTYRDKTDDVGFIDAVTARMQEQFGLGVAQTTVAGMSNGGMMSQRLACQSDRYGSFASVVSNLPVGLRDACTAKPKKAMLIFGTDDDVVHYGGGILAHSGVATAWGEVESAKDTETFFAARNGCTTKAQTTTLADAEIDSTRANIATYPGCRAPLTSITVEGMGHTWPGEDSRLLAWITTRGAVSQQFHATDAMLDFIER